jgi:hypothetical protein
MIKSHALNGCTPNFSMSFIVTWNYTLTIPAETTLVTSLPSFLSSKALGLIYSVYFPLHFPSKSATNDELMGAKTCTYLV